MKFITEIINDFKKCCKWCCPSLFHPLNSQQQGTLQQNLIELQSINDNLLLSPRQKKSRLRSVSLQQTMSLKDQHQLQQDKVNLNNMYQSSGPQKNKASNFYQIIQTNYEQLSSNQKPLIIKRVSSNQNIVPYERRSSSQSSFQTLKSSASRPISRRNFKILRKSSTFYAKHRSRNDDDFYSVNQSDSINNDNPQQHKILTFKFAQNNENYRDGIDMMNIWMKKQYEAYGAKYYRPVLSEITKMKLQTKDLFDSLVHKLEDYYTFYFEDQQHFDQPLNLSRSMSKHYQQSTHQLQQSFTYQQKNHQMICSVNKADGESKSEMDYQKACKFMTLIIIPHCSLPPLAFLQWFNKLQIQSSLHCFNKIEYLQNSQIIDDKVSLEYPLVRVQQFNEKLIGKQTFLLARQIEVAKFQNQDDKETLLEVCFQVADEEKFFQRLIRVTAQPHEGSRAEIYIQSSQNITKRQTSQLLKPMKTQQSEKNFQFAYFEQRWKRFQQKLNRSQVINKKAVQVFTN